MSIKVLITSGVRMFHLPFLACALEKHEKDVDYRLLIVLYPLTIFVKLFNYLPLQFPSKLSDRNQYIPSSRIIISPLSEFLTQVVSFLQRFKFFKGFSVPMNSLINIVFARKASSVLTKMKPNIYHYRCAYGMKSLNKADQVRAIKLCDHSLAHPDHIAHLIESQGVFPNPLASSNIKKSVHLYSEMKFDLQNSDHIVVNSEFVKESLVRAGISNSLISVIELSVDQRIADYSLKNYDQVMKNCSSKLLYAGGWVERKGVDVLNQAIKLLRGKAVLKVAGASHAHVKSFFNSRHIELSTNIKALGFLSREQLALEMIKSPIFVFPSFCEGYAKVIQEAMVCGCYIITTKNSGFSLFPGANATIVEPGDPIALSQAIADAINNPSLHELCHQNREVSQKRFSLETYSMQMAKLYKHLCRKYEAASL